MEVAAIEPVVSSEQVRVWAGLQGFLSLAALIALALFFLLATPFGTPQTRWAWLGPVNDWLAVLGAGPWVVAMILLTLYVGGGPWLWTLTIAASVGAAAIAIVTLLMITGVVGLSVQSVVAVGATLVTFVWAAVAAGAANVAGALPSWVSVVAVAMVAALIVATVIASVGYAAPAGSMLQTTLYVFGAAIAGLAWLAFPAWWLVVASTLA
ncbi:hypothetical protein [Agromyces sp. NPDC049794]|uniref:hypothetical protein n=1 Tax=unclassified Agromyces TaxID=2639701 RepID=UPI0033E755F0